MNHPIAKAVAEAAATLRVDDDMKAVLVELARLSGRRIEELDVTRARREPLAVDALKALLRNEVLDFDPATLVADVVARDDVLPGPAGALPTRLYRPAGRGPFPVILYFHGGCGVAGDKDDYDGSARGLASEAHAVVVSVDCRQAPEHRFPAAWDDALAAFRWVCGHLPELEGMAGRIVMAGEGLGGTLALATAVAARDAGVDRPLCHVLAICPLARTRLDSASHAGNAAARPLSSAMVRWSLDHLVEGPDALDDPRLHLVQADLRRLPAVSLITAAVDPLRSDGEQLERALRRARVPVERWHAEAVTHDFFGLWPLVGKARAARAWAGGRLLEAFASA
ncbi:MAG: alpha/beta hydrolase fold domain-containing protein [Burkholderiales bacterium]|nr:alpha/beta hydrolase fold domain-containing protein [Burkholderiales bacterium]